MPARGSLQGVGCGSPKRAVVVGWWGALMKGNSQQVTPRLCLGVLSQRLDLPLPGGQGVPLPINHGAGPRGHAQQHRREPAEQPFCGCQNPTCSPDGAPAGTRPPPPTPCCSPGWEEGLPLPRAPETGGRAVLSCHIQPTPVNGQPAATGEAISPPEQPHWPRPSSGVRSHPSPQNEKDMLSIRGDFILVT